MQEKIRDQIDKLFVISLAILIFLMAGCTVNNTSEVVDARSEVVGGVEIALAEELPTAAVQTAVSVVMTETMPADNCLDCHTNKEMLIDTAEPEVEVLSESEGEG